MKQEQSEGDRMRDFGAALGWTDIHGGPEEGGAYWRGTPPGSSRVVMCPDWLAEPIPVSEYVLRHFPKPCRPRKRHECRICGNFIWPKEPCCRWTGIESGEGWWTAYAHPECFNITQKWDSGDWECFSPEGDEKPTPRMAWPEPTNQPSAMGGVEVVS